MAFKSHLSVVKTRAALQPLSPVALSLTVEGVQKMRTTSILPLQSL